MEDIENIINIPSKAKSGVDIEEIDYEDVINTEDHLDHLDHLDDDECDEDDHLDDDECDEDDLVDDNEDEIDDEDIEQELLIIEQNKKKEIPEEKKKIVIDRDQENKDVSDFQITGDTKLLEKVYIARIPTIRFWAKKHFYPGLTLSEDDLFGELSIVFVKAIKHYKIKKGSFNTCLYTFFLNRLKNIKSGIHAKKRISAEYEGPSNGMILSLDYSYTDKSGSEVTLKDVIPSEDPTPYGAHSYDDILNLMSDGDLLVKGFLDKVGQGESISTMLKEIKVVYGKKGYSRVSKALKALKKNKAMFVSKIKFSN